MSASIASSNTAPVRAAPSARPGRAVVHRTRGQSHGPITRLISPHDLGEILKPFVFLDLFEASAVQGRGFAPHPHSGIATLTTFLEGRMTYADTTGKSGALSAGAVEWMRAGSGVWHAGTPGQGQPMRGYQLWIALPEALELAPAESLYLEPGRLAVTPTAPASQGDAGALRVLLGTYDGVASPLPAPASITYLHVRLSPGETWTYHPERDHAVAFLALNTGRLHTGGMVLERELAVFAEGNEPITLTAEGAVECVIGSAASHPHPLITGTYSVHTSVAALQAGESSIAALRHTPAVARLAGQ